MVGKILSMATLLKEKTAQSETPKMWGLNQIYLHQISNIAVRDNIG
jgi:hypothetical protein